VRERIARKNFSALRVSDSALLSIANDASLAPANFSAAARFTQLAKLGEKKNENACIGDDSASVLMQLNAFKKSVGEMPISEIARATDYDINWLNWRSQYNAEQMLAALQRNGRGSLCFYGLPGTGKTAFASYLASSLGRNLIKRTAADLLDKFVGGSEKNIRSLFDSANVSDDIIFIDEADGLLRSREHARHSWEQTQVNEFLRCIEDHKGIVIIATNHLSHIDSAFMRRFIFKVEFLPLSTLQRVALFQSIVGHGVDENLVQKLAKLDDLTLGDVAAVNRRFAALDIHPNGAELYAAWREEVIVKPAFSQPIGFVAAVQ
jgi:ATP-dependent Clp protease ATP-binding subunit ClpA